MIVVERKRLFIKEKRLHRKVVTCLSFHFFESFWIVSLWWRDQRYWGHPTEFTDSFGGDIRFISHSFSFD